MAVAERLGPTAVPPDEGADDDVGLGRRTGAHPQPARPGLDRDGAGGPLDDAQERPLALLAARAHRAGRAAGRRPRSATASRSVGAAR